MKIRLVIALIVVIFVVVFSHHYIWARLVRDLNLPPLLRKSMTTVIIILALSPLALFARNGLPLTTMRVLFFPIYVWMGLFALLAVFLVFVDLGIAVWGGKFGKSDHNPERRIMITRLLGLGAAAGAGATTFFASRSALALSRIATKKINIPLAHLPLPAEGFRIVQLSDLHIGPTLGHEWLSGIVQRVNKLRPDLIAITGDLVDGSVPHLAAEVAPLAQLQSTYGSYFCTGNHDYYSGAVEWCEHIATLGIRVLRNERITIFHKEKPAFDLAGIDDYNAEGFAPGHGPNLPAALGGLPEARDVVLLAHQPRACIEAARLGVSLQLSGHTHGGQIWPGHYLVLLQQPYVSGLVWHESMPLYISQGTGFWGPPLRVGTQAEITEITLTRRS